MLDTKVALHRIVSVAKAGLSVAAGSGLTSLVSDTPLSECTFAVTTFNGFKNTNPENELTDISWEQFVTLIAPHEGPAVSPAKDKITYYIPASLKTAPLIGKTLEHAKSKGLPQEGKQRSSSHIHRASILVFDCDDAPQAEWDAALQSIQRAGLAHCAHSSYSHGKTPGVVRARVVLPLDRSVDAADYTRCWKVINGRFFMGCNSDAAMSNPSQVAGVWACAQGNEAHSFRIVHDGPPCSVEALLSLAKPVLAPQLSANVRLLNGDLSGALNLPPLPDEARIRAALRWHDPNDYSAWMNAGMCLRALRDSLGADVAVQLFTEFSALADHAHQARNSESHYNPAMVVSQGVANMSASAGAGTLCGAARDRCELLVRNPDRYSPEDITEASAYLRRYHPQRYDQLRSEEIIQLNVDALQAETDDEGPGDSDGCRVAIDQNGVPRLLMDIGGRYEALCLEGAAARDVLGRIVAARTGKYPGKDTLDREIARLRAEARHAQERCHTWVRVAQGTDRIVLDLGDPAGNIVEIRPGNWTISRNDRYAFVRGRGYGQLPHPQWDAGPREALAFLTDWLGTIGVPESRQHVVVNGMVEWLRPDTPHPVLELNGGAGSGKSTAAEMIASLIDPTTAGPIPSMNIEQEHLAAAAQSRYILLADNVSKLDAESQDLLCRTASGTTVSPRKFYSQTEVEVLPLHAPVLLTGITPVVTRGDLLDRTIRVELLQRDGFTAHSELRAEFERERPRLLGALCTLLAAGMAKLDEVRGQRQWTHRLVDFAQMGEAVMQGAGYERGVFVEELRRLREQCHR